jgi:hypothetical protein
MRSLMDPADAASLDARLARLTPESTRRWGRMTASQMICHLTDAFIGSLAYGVDKPARPATLFGKTIMKWWALSLPWPHGIRTAAGADQERGGTPPTAFESDMARLRAAIARFRGELPAMAGRSHYFFGRLSEREWARWGYQHIDHHLRQFGL